MKLNSKRTLLVGFAFFLICAFWQAYDAIIPLMLINKFGMNQTWSGLIMALDNVLALFMLPLFGALSDKTKTKYGKRTPYIVMGTVLAIACFVGLTFVDNAQLAKIQDGNNELYWANSYTIENSEYESFTNNDVAKEYTIQDYSAKILYNKTYDQLTTSEQAAARDWYVGLKASVVSKDAISQELYGVKANDKSLTAAQQDEILQQYISRNSQHYYTFDKATDTYTIAALDETGATVKGSVVAFANVVSPARSIYAAGVTQGQSYVLIIFVIVLLMTLISMATFRSPAVALMPDVTVKPLRSKANAIINVMGTVGGILVLGLGMLFGTGSVANQTMSYTWYVVAVCSIMLVGLLIFIFTVKEKRWNEEMLAEQARLELQEAEEAATTPVEGAVAPPAVDEKLPKDKLISLILIMASVALWFFGYNAITSKYSVYAVNVLQKDFNSTLIIAQVAAIVSYIPVGLLATKIGRKKTILIGIALLTAAFTGAIFVNNSSPDILIIILFALAGIAWATINVNSFPMVVELSQGGTIGKFTGYYYTASMAAQTLTPFVSGWIMDAMGTMNVLFPYGAIFVALSAVTMAFVKHGDSKPTAPKDKLEMLGDND